MKKAATAAMRSTATPTAIKIWAFTGYTPSVPGEGEGGPVEFGRTLFFKEEGRKYKASPARP